MDDLLSYEIIKVLISLEKTEIFFGVSERDKEFSLILEEVGLVELQLHLRF